MMPSCEVGGKLIGQQFSIASSDKQVYVLTKQAIDEQRPSVNILHLVKQQVFEISIHDI